MKVRYKSKKKIVSVTSRKIDPREIEARQYVGWLQTLPSNKFSDPLPFVVILRREDIDAVEKLTSLSHYQLDYKIENSFDFIRFFGDRGSKLFGVVYMEYCAACETDDEHYSANQTQEFAHVVDAIKVFKLRLESSTPFKAV